MGIASRRCGGEGHRSYVVKQAVEHQTVTFVEGDVAGCRAIHLFQAEGREQAKRIAHLDFQNSGTGSDDETAGVILVVVVVARADQKEVEPKQIKGTAAGLDHGGQDALLQFLDARRIRRNRAVAAWRRAWREFIAPLGIGAIGITPGAREGDGRSRSR